MWIIRAVIVHLLLLGSIFVIYFRSPVITGQKPQETLKLEAPAKRLVLVVTDGLRAESFFNNNCSSIPEILSLILERKGRVGVSHTRLPTESRPGHIALIAGLYEDPSAVTRGWKENPIDFDTVFNRSRKTYAFGANDVLHIFERMADGGGGSDGRRLFIDAYDHELDFSGRDKTYALDEWVFKKVKLLLKRQAKDLQHENQVIFFLHLLGLDSAGHIHKPGSELFLENLNFTDSAIKEIYKTFEEAFPDGKTAYVLTSDHGMTNTGSHGAGDPLETETPFFVWGAGVADMNSQTKTKTFHAGADTILPLFELEQAQMAPLMSALLGQPPPMNNFGMLPRGYLDVAPQYEAEAAHSNALQFLEQFTVVMEEHHHGVFSVFLRQFAALNWAGIAEYKHHISKLLEVGQYERAIHASYDIMENALEGIAYYHSYYRNALLLSTSATFICWILYLVNLLVEPKTSKALLKKQSKVGVIMYSIGLTVFGVLVLLQNVSIAVAFYLVLPIFVSTLAIRGIKLTALWMRLSLSPGNVLLFFVCAEFLVFTFFKREAISLAFLVFAFGNQYNEFRTQKGLKFYLWLLSTLTLSIFPLLPLHLGSHQELFVLAGMLMALGRPSLVKHKLSMPNKMFSIIALLNAFVAMCQHSRQMGIYFISQVISWGFLIFTIVMICMQRGKGLLKQRVEMTFYNLTVLYALFCTSYEGIFVVLLATELTLAISALESNVPAQLDTTRMAPNNVPEASSKKLQSSLRLAVTILLYTFLSFFGTGNIASVSSFDPNIIRCFLTTFSPFVIMALVILKLIIPIILQMSIIFGLSSYARSNEQEIFIWLLLMCDVMGLNFLFLVRNHGSWLDIGSSISHFVIMEVTTLVLLVLINLSKLFLGLPTFTFGLKVK